MEYDINLYIFLNELSYGMVITAVTSWLISIYWEILIYSQWKNIILMYKENISIEGKYSLISLKNLDELNI